MRAGFVLALLLVASLPALFVPVASADDAAATPRRARHRGSARAGLTVVTMPGFGMLPSGGSRFHCVVHGQVSPAQVASRGRFEVLIRNARLGLSNDRRALETRFFETPVSRMVLVRSGNDVIMRFELRAEAGGDVRTEPREGGGTLVVVEFPAGRFMHESERARFEAEAVEPTAVVRVPSGTDGISLATVGTTPRSAAPAAEEAGDPMESQPRQAQPAQQSRQPAQQSAQPVPYNRRSTLVQPTSSTYDRSLDALDHEPPPILRR